MQTRRSLSRAAALAILVPMLTTIAGTAFADEAPRTAAAATKSASDEKPFKKLGERLMERGGGFGKQTVKRLKGIGERVANHMISRPEDLGQLDEIAADVVQSAPGMLTDEARRMKHDSMSDAVRATVGTIKGSTN
jgi:hypothetical protein